MKILLFMIIFGIVVISHELGHFLLAKKNGIRVNEFSVGWGPTLIGFTRGETKYSLKLLPIGGVCIFDEGEEQAEGSLNSAGVLTRISVTAAGPIFNFILAFLMALFIVGGIGYDAPVINSVMPGYSAEEIGIQPGDVIRKLGNKRIHVYREISNYSLIHEGENTPVVYEREGQVYEGILVPKLNEETGRYLFGLQGSGERVKEGPLSVLKYSAYEVKYWISTTVESLGMIFRGRVTKDDFAGPIGMVKIVGDVYESAKPDGVYYIFLNMLNLSILLSANLGVINLLPIPGLDGGRLVFLFLEAVRGKRIDPEKEGMVHFIGLVVLMIFMVFIMFNDIQKFF